MCVKLNLNFFDVQYVRPENQGGSTERISDWKWSWLGRSRQMVLTNLSAKIVRGIIEKYGAVKKLNLSANG